MLSNFSRYVLAVLLSTTPTVTFAEGDAVCEVADILLQPLRLDIVKHKDGYESVILRHDTFDGFVNYGAIVGELTVDRGGFSVRTPDQVVVGGIGPDLRAGGSDCGPEIDIWIKRVGKDSAIVYNGKWAVSTLRGRFPLNDFLDQ